MENGPTIEKIESKRSLLCPREELQTNIWSILRLYLVGKLYKECFCLAVNDDEYLCVWNVTISNQKKFYLWEETKFFNVIDWLILN